MSDTHEVTSTTGRVKWFNNKAGYGFITITDGDKSGTDIFVHHTRIVVESEQYKYLVQGEYVEFELTALEDSDKHEFQASNVKGVRGGKLMCETRNESRAQLRQHNPDDEETRPRRPHMRRRPNNSVPRLNDDEWVLVRRRPGDNYRGRKRVDEEEQKNPEEEN